MMGSKTPGWALAAAISGMALLAVGCGTASSGHPAEALSARSPAKPATSPVGAQCPAGASGSAGRQVPSLDAVQFVSGERGWVAGAGRILATTDGGRNWTRQYAGPASFDQVDFADARHGWAVGVTGLLRTTNGGATWTAAMDPCGSIRSVHFVTPDLGYAIAGGSRVRIDGGVPAPATGGQLMASSDGGQHWGAVAGAPARAQTACFTSATSGYLGTPGKVWRTSDGGGNWTLAFAEPATSAATHQGAPDTTAPDTTVLECAGNEALALFLGSGAAMGHAPYLAYAIDGAHSARALFEEAYLESAARPRVHAPNGPGSYPGPFSMIGPGAAVFVGFNPAAGYGAAALMTVTGSGISRGGDVGGVSQAYGAAFVSVARGWVTGKNARTGRYGIEATADGGHTWTSQYQTRQ